MRLLVAVSMILAGCTMQSTYKDVQDQTPKISFQTTKTADQYLGCISPKAVEIWPTANVLKDGNSWVISVLENQFMAAINITPNANGASVALREWTGATVRSRFQRMRDAVEICR